MANNNLDSFTFNPAGLDSTAAPVPQYYAPGTQWPIGTAYVPGRPVNTTNPQPGVPTLTTDQNWGYKTSGGRKRKRSTHRRAIRKRSTRRRRNKRSARRY
jgi:hypothetical protein